MFKKLFIIAVMSYVVITSSELVAAEWEYVMITIKTTVMDDEVDYPDSEVPNEDQYTIDAWNIKYNPELRKTVAKEGSGGVSPVSFLKALGENGWELVSVGETASSKWSQLWFKRQK